MKIVVSHVVKKDIVKILQNTFDISDAEIVYADNVAIYDYKKKGWKSELKRRMKENLEKTLSDEGEVYFLAVGFIPAVLIAYETLLELGKKVNVLTYNKEERVYDEIDWR